MGVGCYRQHVRGAACCSTSPQPETLQYLNVFIAAGARITGAARLANMNAPQRKEVRSPSSAQDSQKRAYDQLREAKCEQAEEAGSGAFRLTVRLIRGALDVLGLLVTVVTATRLMFFSCNLTSRPLLSSGKCRRRRGLIAASFHQPQLKEQSPTDADSDLNEAPSEDGAAQRGARRERRFNHRIGSVSAALEQRAGTSAVTENMLQTASFPHSLLLSPFLTPHFLLFPHFLIIFIFFLLLPLLSSHLVSSPHVPLFPFLVFPLPSLPRASCRLLFSRLRS